MRTPSAIAALLLTGLVARAGAQGLDLTVNHVGLGIGNVPRIDGLRLNLRDRDLDRVRGINATFWRPFDPMSGTIEGLALGLPMTGAANIRGVATGLLGFSVSESITGLGGAPIGFGTGKNAQGLMLAGIGFGTGATFSGIGVAGIGAGVGSSMQGILIAGGGAGVGSSAMGILVAGIGAAVGTDFTGIGFGGIGLGAGGDITGITFGGIGVGAGRNITGLSMGLIGVAAGNTIRGVAVAGVGVSAPHIEGFAGALGVGAHSAHGIVLAPAYFKIDGSEGEFRGAALSAWNRIQGTQRGLTIGLLNTARELHGVQIGVLNYSENGGRKLLTPIIAVRH